MHSPNTAPIAFSSELAVQIGLEEAVMLSILKNALTMRGVQNKAGQIWCQLEQSRLEQLIPFWKPIDIQRIIQSLVQQQCLYIASAPYSDSKELVFRLASAEPQDTQPEIIPPKTSTHTNVPRANPAFSQAPFRAATPMAANWQPDEDDLRTLTQYGIAREFALKQVPEFIHYWRQKGTSNSAWGSKFAAQVRRKWRDEQQSVAEKERLQPISEEWKPSADAWEILIKNNQIPEAFVSDCVSEFRLYWRDVGKANKSWDSKFIQHVKRQWDLYCQRIKYDRQPRLMEPTWQPDHNLLDILKLANIDHNFALALVPEFVLYWQESGQAFSSWNSKFLQHVKHCWAKRHDHGPTSNNESGNQHGGKATRDKTITELVNDRSWAE